MKIAIAIKGSHLSEALDDRFGRSKYFCIYDLVTKSSIFINNEFAKDESGVGKQVVDLILDQKVEMIIACEFGRKVRTMLENKNIQMVIIKDTALTGDDVIKMIKTN